MKVLGDFMQGSTMLDAWFVAPMDPQNRQRLLELAASAGPRGLRPDFLVKIVGEGLSEKDEPVLVLGMLYKVVPESYGGPILASGATARSLQEKHSDVDGYGTFVCPGPQFWRLERVDTRRHIRTGAEVVLVWLRHLPEHKS